MAGAPGFDGHATRQGRNGDQPYRRRNGGTVNIPQRRDRPHYRTKTVGGDGQHH